MLKLKQSYLSFLAKDKDTILAKGLYIFLYLFSLVYGLAIVIRNFFYDKKIIASYRAKAKVIAIGNISWAGSGKTSLAAWLYRELAADLPIAVLRRGWGEDENKLLKNKGIEVFSGIDRVKIVKDLESKFSLFILDDGFQFRRLRRDLDLVVIGAREFGIRPDLIPVGIFREPWSGLKRADLVVVNYSNQIEDLETIEKKILNYNPKLKIHFADYQFKKFTDFSGQEIKLDYLKAKKVAAFCAIGYPQGFFQKLRELEIKPDAEIAYPDHHELSEQEFIDLENQLADAKIQDLIITAKDKYHFPSLERKINLVIMEVELILDKKDLFLQDIQQKLKSKHV